MQVAVEKGSLYVVELKYEEGYEDYLTTTPPSGYVRGKALAIINDKFKYNAIIYVRSYKKSIATHDDVLIDEMSREIKIVSRKRPRKELVEKLKGFVNNWHLEGYDLIKNVENAVRDYIKGYNTRVVSNVDDTYMRYVGYERRAMAIIIITNGPL